MQDIQALREKLYQLDSQIATLLDERMYIVDKIGHLKRSKKLAILDKSRESQVIQHMQTSVHHPVLKEKIVEICNVIMKESKIDQKFYYATYFPFHRVGCIGVGLLGGSFCKALKTKDPSIEITALANGSLDNKLALEGGWIDQECPSIADLVLSSELILLATPISTILPLAEEIFHASSSLPDKLIIVDIASTKEEIVTAFQKLTVGNAEFIGTHPMAGKLTNGFSNSEATLFVNAPWIIVPHKKNTSPTIKSVESLINYVGANPVQMQIQEHDLQAALISHLPCLLSRKYLEFVQQIKSESLQIAGPGFHSFTRLAHENPELRAEIEKSNGEHIKTFLNLWVEFLKNKDTLK
jgi:prephenate dehydrogenase/chorismate mutase